MRLRTFRARTLPEAMRQLRAELGEDAIIVASRELADGVAVTVAEQGAEDDLASLLAPAEAGSIRAEIAAALSFHGVPATVIRTLEAELVQSQAADAVAALAGSLAQRLRFEPVGLPAGRTVALVGPPGAGKTAAIARFAAAARLAGQPVRVLSADTGRAGGLDQLRALLVPLGIEPEAVSPPVDPAGLAAEAGTLALIDTAGVNPFRGGDVAGLAQWLAPAAIEPVLVLPAGCDPQEAVEIVGVFAAIGVRRCLTTRLDAARRFGSVVAAGATGVALAEASVSPLIGKAMPPLTAHGLARLLLHRRAARNPS